MATSRPSPAVRLQVDIAARVAERGEGAGRLANRDLDRYYTVLADELRREALTENEAFLVLHALMGTFIEPSSYRMLWAEVADDCRLNRAHEQIGWTEAEAQAFAARLRDMPPGHLMAIVDAAERAWAINGDWREDARTVGLVRGGAEDA